MTSILFRPAGYTTLTPFLCVSDGAAAIDLYCTVFGATVASRMDLPAGRVAHAALQLEEGRLQLADAPPEYGLTAPGEVRPVRSPLVDHDPGRGGLRRRGRATGGRVGGDGDGQLSPDRPSVRSGRGAGPGRPTAGQWTRCATLVRSLTVTRKPR
jgi:hypothetical protein